jgi:iron complex outermembrane receptor protein
MFSSRARFFHLLTHLCVIMSQPFIVHAAETDPTQSHAHEHDHDEHEVTETIVVTASPLEHDRDELAIPVDRVERSELLENLGSTLGESISHIPGIASSGFAAGASRPIVRGQDAYRSEVLEDGLRTQDVSRESPDHGIPVNPLAARRVEILRGPATLRYGGGASAGVVNVITNRVPDRLPSRGFQGEVFGGIGLAANERDLAATLDGAHGPVAWHVDGLLRRSNDYAIPNNGSPSVQRGSSVESFTGAVGAAYIHDIGRFGFSYTRAENQYDLPNPDESVEIDMNTDRFRFEGDLNPPVEGVREIRVRGVYSDYEHDEIADGVTGQTFRNKEFEGRVEILHEPLLGLTGALGVHARTRNFRGEGEAAEFLAPADTNTAAVYLYEERDLADGLTAEMGVRIEHTNVKGDDADGIRRDRNFVPISGALSLASVPTDWLTIGIRGAISQRAPSQVELLARGAHEATQTFEIGDPRLDEETSYTGDFRVELRGLRGRLEWSGFVTQYEDYIFASLTGNVVDESGNPIAPTDPDALDELFYDGRDAFFYGTELSGDLDVLELDLGTIGLDGRFDFVRARFTNGRDRNLPRIVPIRWGGNVFFETESFDARIGFARTEAQERTGQFERPTSSYTYLNAALVYRMELGGRIRLEWIATARNLTDVRGHNHLAFNKEDVVLPGRSFRFGLRARF